MFIAHLDTTRIRVRMSPFWNVNVINDIDNNTSLFTKNNIAHLHR